MPIRRHGNGWEVRLQHGGRRLSKTVATRQDALQLEARYRQRSNDHRAGRTPDYSIEEAVARWLTGEAGILKSHANLVNKTRTIYPHIRGRKLTEIASAAEDVKAAGIKAGLTPATINRRLAILRRVARLAFRQWDWLDRDLAGKIRLLPGEKARHLYLTQAQVRKLAAAASPKVGQAIRWASLTGLRRGELLSLTPAHFTDGAIVLTETKNGRPRIVPLPPELDPKRFPYGLTEADLEKGFRKARQKAAMPSVRFHDLRHTYASWLAQGGSTPVQMRDLLGHSSLAVTSRYAHLGRRDLWEAVQGLSVGLARGTRGKKKAA